MSQLHMELEEQAGGLGFRSLEEALANGYDVDYSGGRLVDGREQAHKNWLAERDAVVKDLLVLHQTMLDGDYTGWATIINNAVKFIERGEV